MSIFLTQDDMQDYWCKDIPELKGAGFFCSKRKYCSYKLPLQQPLIGIGKFVENVGFLEIKKHVHPDYKKCVSRRQIKLLWKPGSGKIPLLAFEITNALFKAGLDIQSKIDLCEFLISASARLEVAQEHEIALNCSKLSNLLDAQEKKMSKIKQNKRC